MREIQYHIYKKWFLAGLLLCLLIVVSSCGCANNRISVKNDNLLDDKEGLRESFNQYWRFIAGKEVEKTFACEAPYVQEMVNKNTYRLYQKNFLMKADLKKVEVLNSMVCEQPFKCCIDCRLYYDAEGRKKVSERQDCWVLVDGSWYHVLRSPLFFPM